MSIIACLIVCLTLWTSTFAENWYPENIVQISKRCEEQYPLPSAAEVNGEVEKLYTNPKIHANVLCIARTANLYSEESGFNVDRLAKEVFKGVDVPEGKRIIQDCIEKHKGVVSKGEMLVKVSVCVENEAKRDHFI